MIFTSSLAGAAPVSQLRWPALAAASFLLLGLINPFAYGPTSSAYPQLLGMLCAGLFVLALICAPAGPGEQRWPLGYCLVALGLLLLCAPHATSSKLYTNLTLWVMWLGGGLVLAAVMSRRELATTVLACALLAAALLNFIFGLLQFLKLSAGFFPWISHPGEVGMVYGNIRQPNQFASLMSLGIAAAWYFAQLHARQYGLTRGLKVLFEATLAIFVLGIVLSASRMGVLQLVLFALVALSWHGFAPREQKPPRFFTVCFVLLPVFYLVLWLAMRELAPQFGLSLRLGLERSVDGGEISRVTLYANVLELIKAAPVFGYGVGELGYAHFMHVFGEKRHLELLDNAHNVILQTWVELGVFAVLLITVPLLVRAARVRVWALAEPAQQLGWLVIAALALHSGLEYPLHYAQFWILFCVALAVVFDGAALQMARAAADRWLYALAVLFIAGFAYLAWDYDRISQAYGGPQRRAAADDMQPLEQAQHSHVFKPFAQFAKLTMTDVSAANMLDVLPLGLELLHFSAEPRVVERVVQSYMLLRDKGNAERYAARMREAFPSEYKAFYEQQAPEYRAMIPKP